MLKMRYLILPLTLVLFSINVFAVTVLEGDALSPPQRLQSRKLSAASRHSIIQARSDSFTLSNEVEVTYADGSANGIGVSTIAATVRLASTQPILVLEDIEHLLHSIECTSTSIEITVSESTHPRMCERLHNLNGGHVITSHITCNNASSRQAYKVLSTTQLTPSTISFTVIPVSWRDKTSFTSLSLSLNNAPTAAYRIRNDVLTSPTPALNKRQIAYDNSNFSFNAPPTISSYNALPSSIPSGSTHSFDLSTFGPFINTQYPLHYPGSLNPAPVAVGCANCTLWGTLDLTFANFDVSIDGSITGTATLAAKGVGAHILLAANLTDTWYFTFPLASRSYALAIDGFGEVDFAVGEFVAGGYRMQGNVGMKFGFDMSVPDTASVTLNVGSPDSSSEVGFENTAFTALPFESRASIQSLELWLALRSAVTVTLKVEGQTLGDAGAYIDVPRLNAKVTPVQNVDVNCKPLSDSTPDRQDDQNILKDVIKVDVYGSWDYGAFAQLKYVGVDVPSYFAPSPKAKIDTMCLNFDREAQSYSTAKEAVQGTGKTVSAPGVAILALIVALVVVVMV